MTREVERLRITGPFACCSLRTAAERERQLFADVSARFVNDRQAVGVGVLGKTDGRPGGWDDRGDTPSNCLGGLGRWSYRPSGSPPRIAAGNPAPQQRLGHPPAGSVAGVEHNLESAAADRRHVDDSQDGRQMPAIGISRGANLSQRSPSSPRRISRFCQRSSMARPCFGLSTIPAR